MTSTLILRNVRVLAIDQIADETTQGALIARTATLEVTQEQSQKLSVASKVGSLDLVLRPMRINDDVLDEVSEPIDVRDLTTDNSLAVKEDEPVKTVKKRTYKPIYSSAKAAPKPDPFTQMRVTRGTETSQTRVAKDGETVPNLNQATSNQIGVMTDTISAVVGGQ